MCELLLCGGDTKLANISSIFSRKPLRSKIQHYEDCSLTSPYKLPYFTVHVNVNVNVYAHDNAIVSNEFLPVQKAISLPQTFYGFFLCISNVTSNWSKHKFAEQFQWLICLPSSRVRYDLRVAVLIVSICPVTNHE